MNTTLALAFVFMCVARGGLWRLLLSVVALVVAVAALVYAIRVRRQVERRRGGYLHR